MSITYVDVYLPDKLLLIDYYAAVLVSRKDCSFDATIGVISGIDAQRVKQVSLDFGTSVTFDVEPTHRAPTRLNFTVGTTVAVHSQSVVENAMFDVTVGVETDVKGSAMRQRMLSDLKNMTLEDINDMTLQELYWIDKTV